MPAPQKILDVLGEVIAQARHERGLTQDELVALAGGARNYLSQVERGKREVGIRVILKLMNALRIPFAEFGQRLDERLSSEGVSCERLLEEGPAVVEAHEASEAPHPDGELPS